MIRRKVKRVRSVNGILTSDWHLREDIPICRVDNFWDAQWDKVRQISDLQNKYNCPVYHAGDLFHHWKPSPYLITETIQNLPSAFYTVCGQHDLPQHNLDLFYKTGVATLSWADVVNVIEDGSWGEEPGTPPGEPDVRIWHRFVWDGKKIPWPGCDEMTALEVLKKYPEAKLIVTGDHHKSFVQAYKGRVLVNPGCLTRQASDYVDHKPRVYLWDQENNEVEAYFLEVGEDVVSRDHILIKEARDKRIEAFVSKLNSDLELDISFEENLDRFIKSNRLRKNVVDVVYKAIES